MASINLVLAKIKKKQELLLVIFLIVMVITGIVVWEGFFKKEKTISPELQAPVFRQITINFQILDNPLLQELKQFDLIPPFEGTPGRKNPFLPF